MNASISHSFVVRGIVMAGLLLVATHGAWAAAAFTVPAGERQLFLDDVGIAKIENLTRTMHPPAKKGAVIRPDYHSGVRSYQTRSAPMWDRDAKVFRYWLHGVPSDIGPVWTCSYVESKDGLFWTRPNLGQVEYRGSRDNNYPIGSAVYGVYDPTDPDPTRRFKSLTRKPGPGCHLLQPLASDGITWREVGNKTLKMRKGDEDNFSFSPIDHLFIATLRHNGGPYGRAVDLATSKDFESWKHHGLIFHADKKDQEVGIRRIKERLADPTLKQTEYDVPSTYSVQVYNMGVFRYESMYIGLPSMYHQTGTVPPSWPGFKKMHLSPNIRAAVSKQGDYTGFYNIQLVCSRTMMLNTWKRLGDRQPFIKTSRLGAGAYDTQTIIGPSNAVVRGDELWFYYTGIRRYALISCGGEPGYDDYFPDAGAICLAVLRRDGFISLDAGTRKGTILTDPFKAPGGKLFVNVAGGKGGELRVDVLDASGKVLAASEPVVGDQPRAEVTWQKDKTAAFGGKVVSLRFSVRNASFYSYWLE